MESSRIVSLSISDGHTHDFTLFKESVGFSLPEEILVFVDLGYLGILNFHENTFIPKKSSKNHPLEEADKQLNREISSIRIAIEHLNAKFKTFQMMAIPYRNHKKRFEIRAQLICGIINLES